jgi:hypothetical protein
MAVRFRLCTSVIPKEKGEIHSKPLAADSKGTKVHSRIENATSGTLINVAKENVSLHLLGALVHLFHGSDIEHLTVTDTETCQNGHGYD